MVTSEMSVVYDISELVFNGGHNSGKRGAGGRPCGLLGDDKLCRRRGRNREAAGRGGSQDTVGDGEGVGTSVVDGERAERGHTIDGGHGLGT